MRKLNPDFDRIKALADAERAEAYKIHRRNVEEVERRLAAPVVQTRVVRKRSSISRNTGKLAWLFTGLAVLEFLVFPPLLIVTLPFVVVMAAIEYVTKDMKDA